MTAVRQIPMSESEQIFVDAERRGNAVDRNHAFALWRQYGEEGHLVVLTHMRGEVPGESWYAHCANCKDNAWGMTPKEIAAIAEFGVGDSAHPEPWLHFGQARWWAYDHRREHGLEKQEFCPSVPLDYAIARLEEEREK